MAQKKTWKRAAKRYRKLFYLLCKAVETTQVKGGKVREEKYH
jgi:hypothetical protein